MSLVLGDVIFFRIQTDMLSIEFYPEKISYSDNSDLEE